MKHVLITLHERIHAEIHHFVTQANKAQTEVQFRHVRLTEVARNAFSGSPLDVKKVLEDVRALREHYRVGGGDALIAIVDGNLQDDRDDEYFIVNGLDHSTDEVSFEGSALVSLHYLNPISEFMKASDNWWRSRSELQRRRVTADSVLLLLLGIIAYDFTGLKFHEDCNGCVMDYCQSPAEILDALRGGFSFCDDVCRPTLDTHENGALVKTIADRLNAKPFKFVRPPSGEFDVLLLHDSTDRDAARDVARQLRDRGIVPWLHQDQASDDGSWRTVLKQQIDKIGSVAVLIGRGTPWDDQERASLIQRFVALGRGVQLVILPSAKDVRTPPTYIRDATWIDFRKSESQPLQRLVWAITEPSFPSKIPDADVSTSELEPTVAGGAKQRPSSATESPLVLSLHGINTRGAWQKDLDHELAKAGLTPQALDYGLFRVLRLMNPASRRRQIDWFRDEYTRIRRESGQVPSLVAHSFGTYLVASAVELYEEIELDHVILCGSIVRTDFEWSRVKKRGQVNKILNERGGKDVWVKTAAWVLSDGGQSGVGGFSDLGNGLVNERFHPGFRHSDYFYRLNFERNWIPFLKGSNLLERELPRPRRINWRFVFTIGSIVVAIAFLLWIIRTHL